MRTRSALSVILLAAALVATIAPGRAEPGSNASVELRDDVSRSELGRRALLEEFQGVLPAAPKKAFEFPADARDAVYGIDVSHHNEDGGRDIEWSKLPPQGVFFVYAKATQGRRFYDGRFERTWDEIGKLRDQGRDVYRGAYHFLSANVDPVMQAGNFLAAIGSLGQRELPPCVDIEWDEGPDHADRWNSYTEPLVVARLQKFIAVVEAATGRKPVIYTAKSWWKRNIPTSKAFVDYPIWIADYGTRVMDPTKPVHELEPRVMDGHKWAIWQFTDSGKTTDGGLKGGVDVNLFKGTASDFKTVFGVGASEPQPPVPPPAPPTPPPGEQPTPPPPQTPPPPAPQPDPTPPNPP